MATRFSRGCFVTMRRVVFVGNCQGRRLQEFYRETLAYLNDDITDFVVSYDPLTEEIRQTLLSADVIVAQAIDSEHPVDIGKVDTTAKTIWYPNVTGIFLWPWSGVEHIRNKPLPHFDVGPCNLDFGDRWLNREIAAGVPPSDIVRKYLDLDV